MPLLAALLLRAATAAPVSPPKPGPPDSEKVWAEKVGHAFALVKQGNYAEALKIVGPELPPNLRNTQTAVQRVVALALIDWYSDKQGPALKKLERAYELAKPWPELQIKVLGLRASLTGDVDAAEEAVRVARRLGDVNVLVTNEIALVMTYGLAGRGVDAVRLAETLIPRAEALGVAGVSFYGNAGWVYSLIGDYEQAIAAYTKAEEVASRTGDVSNRVINLTNIGNLHVERGEYPAAARAYGKVLEILRDGKEDHQSKAHALAQLARVQLESGKAITARRTVAEAIRHEEAARDDEDELIARMVEARIDIETGNYAAALKTLEPAATVTNSRTRIEAFDQLGRAYAALGRNDDARKAFEKALADVHTERKTATDVEQRIAFSNLAAEIYDDYIDFCFGLRRPEEALRLAERSRVQTLEERRIGAAAASAIDPKAIAKARGATILSYWLGRRRSYLWTITANGIAVAGLPRERYVNREIERFRRDVETSSGSLVVRGAALYKLLAEPAKIAPGSRVIVVPDGSLHTINFETLVSGSGPRYWIEDVTVENAGSLHLLAQAANKSKATAPMLLIGDPRSDDPAFPALTQAPDEIARIRKLFANATFFTGADATPNAYLGAKPERFEFIHFVAHGIASRIRPLDSAIILSRDKKGQRLLARDVANQKLAARLVTISSCEGAGSATYAGEGLVGLAWAFRAAGAQQVIAALWEVSDASAPWLMDSMYKEILNGKVPASALRKAKLDLLHSKTALRQPKHWAPFVIYV